MTTLLATKHDLRHLEQVIEARLAAFDARLDALEWRLVVKLGGLYTALFGIAGIVYSILR